MDEETRKQKAREYNRKWRQTHREKHNENCRKWQSKHREIQQKRVNDYHETKQGRAVNLLTSYRQFDARRFGVYPNLTKEDIIRICFSDDSRCIWCGSSDWHVLGLDRHTNQEPHDVGNVYCACHDCNVRRHKKNMGEFMEVLGITMDQWMEQTGSKWGPTSITIICPDKDD